MSTDDLDDLLIPDEHTAWVSEPRASVPCICTPHDQDAGGGYVEHLLEYEPSCPEHSVHLWDPTLQAWVLKDPAPTPEEIETLAKALYANGGREHRDFPWNIRDEVTRNHYRENAKRTFQLLKEARNAR